jgi:hypothetical protein
MSGVITDTGRARIAGASTGPVAIVVIAEGVLSGPAITAALATIGFGTMMGGFVVIGLGSFAVAWGVKKIVRKAMN